jgi:hypothetical protein
MGIKYVAMKALVVVRIMDQFVTNFGQVEALQLA